MSNRQEILDSLVGSLDEDNDLNEIKLSTVAKAAAGVGAAALILKALRLPKPSKYSKRISAVEYAKALVKAKNNKESLVAVTGLLNIAARVLMSIPELRDLGFRVMKVVQSERLADFMED